MKIHRLALAELRRLTSGRMLILAVIGMILVPTIYSGLYLYANKDPYANMKNVPAAVVVDDAGTTLDGGERLLLGDQVAAKLVDSKSFQWHRVTRDQAQEGVEDDTYAFALVLPKGFSDDIASSGTAHPRQATIEQITNDANGYLSHTISNTVVTQVTKSVAQQVASTAASRYLEGFATIHTKITEAGKGAEQLAQGAAKLDGGADQLAKGSTDLVAGQKKLAAGADQLAAGAHSATDGAAQLSSGAGRLDSGLATLDSKTETLPDATARLAAGAHTLADGNGRIADGAKTLATGAGTAASGATQLKGGAEKLNDGAKKLAPGLHTLADGNAKIATGASTLADGAGTASRGATALKGGAQKLNDGAKKVAAGAHQVADGNEKIAAVGRTANKAVTDLRAARRQNAKVVQDQIDALDRANQSLPTPNPAITDAVARLRAQLTTLGTRLDAVDAKVTNASKQLDTLATGSAQVAAGADQLVTGSATLATKSGALATGVGKLSTGATALSDAATKASAGATTAAKGADQLAAGSGTLATKTGELATGVGKLSTGATTLSAASTKASQGARTLAAGADQLHAGSTQLRDGIVAAHAGSARLATGASTLSGGLGTLTSGADQLAAGEAKAVTGTTSLKDGATKLAAGTESAKNGAARLHDGLAKGLDAIPNPSAQQRTAAAQVVGNPVAVDSASQATAGSYGAGMAPFFGALSLWIGAYVLFLLVRPLSNRALAANQPAWRVAVSGWLTPALLAAVQSALVLLIGIKGQGIDVKYLLPTLVFMAFVSMVYAAILQMLAARFGSVGKFLGLVLMVVQLVSAGGTFPWQTLPAPLQALHHVLPMTYAIDGLRHLMYGGSMAIVWVDVLVLAVFLAVALTLSGLAARWARIWTPARVKPDLVL